MEAHFEIPDHEKQCFSKYLDDVEDVVSSESEAMHTSEAWDIDKEN